MRFYQQQHRFYCGVDLHARSMYLCILDPAGHTLLHRDHPASAQAFLDVFGAARVADEEMTPACCNHEP